MRYGGGARSGSYAVLWCKTGGGVCSGELALVGDALRLEGMDRQGEPCSVKIPYREVRGVRIGRAPTDRLDGRAALVIRLAAEQRLLVASAVGLGMIHEMADRLAAAGLVLEPPP